MSRRIKALAMVMAALMALSLAACSSTGNGSGSSSEGNVEYVIRLGHSDTEDNLLNVSLRNYADWVNKETDGRVIVRIYPNE